MHRRSGRVPAALLASLFFVATLGACSTTQRSDPRAAMSAAEQAEATEDEILSPPYGDEEELGTETTEEKAGGAMVATLFVGVILALAAVPILLFGPLGLL